MPKVDASFNPEEYTPVAERVALFYKRYPTGRINTRLLSYENRRVVVEASVYRWESSSNPAATGLASEHEGDGEINAVACLENTETSAVGRALANLGITGSVLRPSREEMEKAARGLHSRSARQPYVPPPATQPSDAPVADQDVLRVAEIRRAGTESLQEMAAEHLFALKLLGRAERAGLPPERAGELRRALDAEGHDAAACERIAMELRMWLRRRAGYLRQGGPGTSDWDPYGPDVPTPPL